MADQPRAAYVDPTLDPEFYCLGQKCLDDGCTPLHCKKAVAYDDWMEAQDAE